VISHYPLCRSASVEASSYFTYTGVMDTAIAIRTLLVKDGFVHLQAGGGIVYDSVDEEEYEETMNKMRGVEVAVQRAVQAKKKHL